MNIIELLNVATSKPKEVRLLILYEQPNSVVKSLSVKGYIFINEARMLDFCHSSSEIISERIGDSLTLSSDSVDRYSSLVDFCDVSTYFLDSQDRYVNSNVKSITVVGDSPNIYYENRTLSRTLTNPKW